MDFCVHVSNAVGERRRMWQRLASMEWYISMVFVGDWNQSILDESSLEQTQWLRSLDAVGSIGFDRCEDLCMETRCNKQFTVGFRSSRLE